VILKVASTLDGKAATRTGDSKWITGPEARRRGRQLRAELDAICAGIGTVLADDPRLTARARGARDPIRVVLDSRLRTPPEAQVLPANSRSKARCIIAATDGASAARQRRLEGAGAEIWRLGRGARVDVEALLARLAGADVTSLMVEGGPRTHASFIAAAALDELHMFLGPRLFGGRHRGGGTRARHRPGRAHRTRPPRRRPRPASPALTLRRGSGQALC
jgi:diaminohydroxyphosphoribosylaminopyrimidine deaminase/5-amino-6-(5-phosphoribosylamino)uracil reductase